MKNILLAGIAFVALVAPAAAADMPIKALPPVPIDIWTGGYVGVNVGYGWGRDHINSTGSPGRCTQAGGGCTGGAADAVSPVMAQALTFQTSLNRSGVIYGGQWGHNWKVNNVWNWGAVVGVEADFDGVSDSHSTSFTSTSAIPGFAANPISQTATLSERINSLGTLRGRAGLLWGENTLVYVTGGLAFANARATSSFNQFINGPVGGGTAPYFGAGQLTQELFGPTIGGGIEWKWTANWSVKAEYLYADLGNLTLNTNTLIAPQLTTGLTFGSANAQTSSHVHESIGRVGIDYRFW